MQTGRVFNGLPNSKACLLQIGDLLFHYLLLAATKTPDSLLIFSLILLPFLYVSLVFLYAFPYLFIGPIGSSKRFEGLYSPPLYGGACECTVGFPIAYSSLLYIVVSYNPFGKLLSPSPPSPALGLSTKDLRGASAQLPVSHWKPSFGISLGYDHVYQAWGS